MVKAARQTAGNEKAPEMPEPLRNTSTRPDYGVPPPPPS